MHPDPQYRPTFAAIRCVSRVMSFVSIFSPSNSKRLARLLHSLESEPQEQANSRDGGAVGRLMQMGLI